MTKYLALLILIFAFSNQFSFSQERVNFESLFLHVDGEQTKPLDDPVIRSVRLSRGLVYYQNNLFTGIGFNNNRDEREIITFKDGKRHGVSEGWWANGNNRYEEEFYEGVRHGTSYSWFEDNHPRSIGEYIYGQRHGEHRDWCFDSFEDEYNLIRSINYKNGKLHGSYQEWFCNGRIEERRSYLNGERDGVSIEYYYNGQIKERTNYLEGEKHGKSEAWYEDGEIRWLREYRNGERID